MSNTPRLGLPLLALVLVALPLLAACGFERGDDGRLYPAPETPLAELVGLPAVPDAGTERFAGTWLIDQPYHAGYEASFYTFQGDGTLIHEGNTGYTPYETVGQVVAMEGPCGEWGCDSYEAIAVCFFGSAWSAPTEDTVHIAGDCDDDEERRITLTFAGPASGNAVGWGQEDVEANLEGFEPTHTGHGSFEWRFKKCFDADGAAIPEAFGEGWGCEQFSDFDED